jgi:hypothetical protein
MTDHASPAVSGTVRGEVRCESCVHIGYRNAHLIRCKYPRERAPAVVDLTDELGYTRNWAAEVCDKYSPNQALTLPCKEE